MPVIVGIRCGGSSPLTSSILSGAANVGELGLTVNQVAVQVWVGSNPMLPTNTWLVVWWNHVRPRFGNYVSLDTLHKLWYNKSCAGLKLVPGRLRRCPRKRWLSSQRKTASNGYTKVVQGNIGVNHVFRYWKNRRERQLGIHVTVGLTKAHPDLV